MDFYPLFEWFEATPIGAGIKDSIWLFPVIETVHLLALATLGGAVLMVDLRLLGAGLTGQPPSLIERNVRPWLIGAILTMATTGVLLGLSEALKLYGKPAFWVKMCALAAALVFTFTVRNPLARRDAPSAMAARIVAAISLTLWLTVALAGRWIGFS